jgi:large subunit ribosomal protein L13
MLTHKVKPTDIQKKWYIIDASGQTVGRLASEVARLLRGKHKPTFVSHLDCGDNVIIVNAEKVVFTGNKWEEKNFYHHSGWIGGIKAIPAKVMLATYPERILTHAVRGMIPKNKLGRKVIANLKVYKGPDHPHAAQNPVAPAPRLQRN